MNPRPDTPGYGPAAPLSTGDVKSRALRGVASTFSSHLSSQAIRFGLGVFLARRLTTDDFGLVAIVIAATNTADLLRDQGLSNVILQARDMDERKIDSIFWFMTALTALEMVLLAALAPCMAAFYNRPELLRLTWGLALASAVSGLAAVPLALLRRQMRFDRLARIQIASLLLSAPIIAGAAAAGLGFWTLVIYLTLPPFLNLIGAWRACDWFPRHAFSRDVFRPLAAQGRRFIGVDLLTFWSQTAADALILGRLLPGGEVGLYQRTQSTKLVATQLVDATLTPVALSSLARLQDRPEAFWKTYRVSIYSMAAVLAPGSLVLMLAPGECLGYVFGSKWIAAAPAMRIAALLFLLHPLLKITHAGLFALGRPDLLFRWLLGALVLLAAGLVLGSRWGLAGAAAGMVAAQTLALPVGLHGFASLTGTRIRALVRPMLPVTAAVLALALLTFPLSRLAGPVSVAAGSRLAVALAAAAVLCVFLLFHAGRSEAGRLLIETAGPALPGPLRKWLAKQP